METLGFCMACKIALTMEHVKDDQPLTDGRHAVLFECPTCGRRGPLEYGWKEFQRHQEDWNRERRARGAAVSWFRKVLDEVDTVEDIVEWEVPR